MGGGCEPSSSANGFEHPFRPDGSGVGRERGDAVDEQVDGHGLGESIHAGVADAVGDSPVVLPCAEAGDVHDQPGPGSNHVWRDMP